MKENELKEIALGECKRVERVTVVRNGRLELADRGIGMRELIEYLAALELGYNRAQQRLEIARKMNRKQNPAVGTATAG